MGNSVLTCYKGTAKVAVILADGRVEEYLRPVRVATVLQQHPKHMVVKLSNRRKLAERRSKLTFLRPEQTLKCKRQYLVLPNQTVGGKFVDCWALASHALETTAKRAKMKKLKERKYAAAKLFSSSALSYSTEQDNFRTPLLDSEDDVQSLSCLTGTSQSVFSRLYVRAWAALDNESWRCSRQTVTDFPEGIGILKSSKAVKSIPSAV